MITSDTHCYFKANWRLISYFCRIGENLEELSRIRETRTSRKQNKEFSDCVDLLVNTSFTKFSEAIDPQNVLQCQFTQALGVHIKNLIKKFDSSKGTRKNGPLRQDNVKFTGWIDKLTYFLETKDQIEHSEVKVGANCESEEKSGAYFYDLNVERNRIRAEEKMLPVIKDFWKSDRRKKAIFNFLSTNSDPSEKSSNKVHVLKTSDKVVEKLDSSPQKTEKSKKHVRRSSRINSENSDTPHGTTFVITAPDDQPEINLPVNEKPRNDASTNDTPTNDTPVNNPLNISDIDSEISCCMQLPGPYTQVTESENIISTINLQENQEQSTIPEKIFTPVDKASITENPMSRVKNTTSTQVCSSTPMIQGFSKLSPIPENSKNTTESTSNEQQSPPCVELKDSPPTLYTDTVTDSVKTGSQKIIENVGNLLNSSESPEKLLKLLKSESANSNSQMDTQKLLETQNLIDPETINSTQIEVDSTQKIITTQNSSSTQSTINKTKTAKRRKLINTKQNERQSKRKASKSPKYLALESSTDSETDFCHSKSASTSKTSSKPQKSTSQRSSPKKKLKTANFTKHKNIGPKTSTWDDKSTAWLIHGYVQHEDDSEVIMENFGQRFPENTTRIKIRDRLRNVIVGFKGSRSGQFVAVDFASDTITFDTRYKPGRKIDPVEIRNIYTGIGVENDQDSEISEEDNGKSSEEFELLDSEPEKSKAPLNQSKPPKKNFKTQESGTSESSSSSSSDSEIDSEEIRKEIQRRKIKKQLKKKKKTREQKKKRFGKIGNKKPETESHSSDENVETVKINKTRSSKNTKNNEDQHDVEEEVAISSSE